MDGHAITSLSQRNARAIPEVSPVIKAELETHLQGNTAFSSIKALKKAPSLQLVSRKSTEHIATHLPQENKQLSLSIKSNPEEQSSIKKIDLSIYEAALNGVLVRKIKDTKALARVEQERKRLNRSTKKPNWFKRKLKHFGNFFKKEGLQNEGIKDQLGLVETAALNTRGAYEAKKASSSQILQAITSPQKGSSNEFISTLETIEDILGPAQSIATMFSLAIAIKELEDQHRQGKSLQKAYKSVKEKLNQFSKSTRDSAEAYQDFLENAEDILKECNLYEEAQQSILELLENPTDENKRQAVESHLREHLENAVKAFKAHKYLGKEYTKHHDKKRAIIIASIGRAATATASGIMKAAKLTPEIIAPLSSTAGTVASLFAIPLYIYRAHKDHQSIKKRDSVYAAIKTNYKDLDKIPDHELQAIIKLIKKKNSSTQKKISFWSNSIEAGGYTCAAALGIVVLLAEVGIIATGVGLAITPVGWALGGALAAITLGWVGYKIGKFCYRAYKKSQYKQVLQHKGKLFEKLRKTHSVEEIDKIAHDKLIRRDKKFALNVLYEALLTEEAYSHDKPSMTFLKTIGLEPKEIQAIINSADRKVALALLGKRLNMA
tara:strand:+ start:54999 stop:56819 length:1821 start_codon:yes stop_codon:yes gene_type:complete